MHTCQSKAKYEQISTHKNKLISWKDRFWHLTTWGKGGGFVPTSINLHLKLYFYCKTKWYTYKSCNNLPFSFDSTGTGCTGNETIHAIQFSSPPSWKFRWLLIEPPMCSHWHKIPHAADHMSPWLPPTIKDKVLLTKWKFLLTKYLLLFIYKNVNKISVTDIYLWMICIKTKFCIIFIQTPISEV